VLVCVASNELDFFTTDNVMGLISLTLVSVFRCCTDEENENFTKKSINFTTELMKLPLKIKQCFIVSETVNFFARRI
jgi:hypothetical protein